MPTPKTNERSQAVRSQADGRAADRGQLRPAYIRAGIVVALLLGCGLPLAGTATAHVFLSSRLWMQGPFHAAIEAVGAFAGLTLATFLLLVRRYKDNYSHHLWTASGLLGMGVLDGFHACSSPGNVFVWLRTLGTLVGGLGFVLVCLPKGASRPRLTVFFPVLFLTTAGLLGAVSVARPDLIPAMVHEGRFTRAAEILNLIGGLGFLGAAGWFLTRDRCIAGVDNLLFAAFCLLFGIAGAVFGFSRLWDADWWWWHFLRLGAYLVVLGQVLLIYQRGQGELYRLNESLEQRVAERTAVAEARSRALTQSEQALREARIQEIALKQQFKLLLDSTAEAIYGVDLNGICVFCNPACFRLLGYHTPDVLLGKQMHDLIHHTRTDGSPYPVRECRIYQAFREGKGTHVDDEVFWRADGSSFLAEYWSNPMFDNGTLTGTVVTFVDITERKRIEVELHRVKEYAEAANRTKSEFLANMSHEIRTPMNGILGMTELTLGTELTREQRDNLGMVKSSADSLLQVINDILDFSKIEAHKLDLDPTPFALRDSLGDALKTVAERAQGKGLELVCQIDDDVPDGLVGDAGRLRQVAINLIGNAIKFTEQGEVLVRVAVEQQIQGEVLLHFSVTDTGIGIPAAKIGAVFEPFVQADGSTTRKYGGTGLGLTICVRLVELMGGRIWAESELGKGSTFHFTARFGRASGSLSRAWRLGWVGLVDLPVLIVDDNATNRGILVGMLRSWRMQPVAVEGGEVALGALRDAAKRGEPFPLVLLDMMMPGMDGLTVVEHIRSSPALVGTNVVMLSSAGSQEAARCRAAGVDLYLMKPTKQSELLDVITQAVGGTSEERAGETRRPPLITPSGVRLKALDILLTEDNIVNQKLAVRVLEKDGHRLTVADNGLIALELSAKRRFDLILMDLQMPEMGGLEATAAIRTREEGTGWRQPIVAMTAHAMKGDAERCLAAGMDGYVSKPVRFEELTRVIARVLPGSVSDASIVEQTRPSEPPPALRSPEPSLEPEPAATPVDRSAALQCMSGDEDLLREIAGLFVQEYPRQLEELSRAIGRGDAIGARRAAHTIKGAVGNFGARSAVALAIRIESLATDGSLAEVGGLFADLKKQLAEVATELSVWSA